MQQTFFIQLHYYSYQVLRYQFNYLIDSLHQLSFSIRFIIFHFFLFQNRTTFKKNFLQNCHCKMFFIKTINFLIATVIQKKFVLNKYFQPFVFCSILRKFLHLLNLYIQKAFYPPQNTNHPQILLPNMICLLSQ